MSIITTIVPVFVVIFIGWAAKRRGFLTASFIDPANRLVYHLAIPAMVFSAIAGTDLKSQVNPLVIAVAYGVMLATAAIAWIVSRHLSIPDRSRGTFIQTAFHGNLGYIGFAVVYYYLGSDGLVKAAILAGFIMILQNVMAVFLLQHFCSQASGLSSFWQTFKKAVANPVIVSALIGILFSLLEIPLPTVVERSLGILKGMALPLALLIIGASLSFRSFKFKMTYVAVSGFLKLLIMPVMAWLCFLFLPVPRSVVLPAMILMAAPSATLTYVLAKEIGGDPELAGSAVSLTTLASALTYILWLHLI